jgi:tRNA(fMet)-specific endonuclease VapC
MIWYVMATTLFNVAELWVGVERADDHAVEQQRVNAILDGLVVLPFDEMAARYFARITAYLLAQGKPMGDMDALIAAVALANGHLLVTSNPRHFSDNPGLALKSV